MVLTLPAEGRAPADWERVLERGRPPLFLWLRESLSGTCCTVGPDHGRLWAGSWQVCGSQIKEIGYGQQ